MQPERDIETMLLRHWQAVAPRMAALPVYNPSLRVQVTTFRRHAAWRVGVVVTPWFMNVTALPNDAIKLPAPGSAVALDLPAGRIDATVGQAPGVGRFAAASLFSPMDMFDDPAVTEQVAAHALAALFAAEEPLFAAEQPAGMDRRALLRGWLTRERVAP